MKAGTLTLTTDPSAGMGGATKSYVDNAITTVTFTAGPGLTLSNKAFSVNTSNSIALVANNVVVRSTALTGQLLLSTGTAGAEATWGSVTLSQANSVTGVLGVTNGGTGAANATAARASLGLPTSVGGVYRRTFSNANIVANTLTVTHSLGQQYVQVTVIDESNRIIQPDEVTMSNSSTAIVELASWGTITGTWNVVVIG